MIYDVLIVGGGPAGTTAATLLARAGLKTALVEKKLFPRNKVCGEFISATNLPLFQELGLEQNYITQGGPEIRRVGLFAKKYMITALMPNANYFGRALERYYLDNLLLQKAKEHGAELFQPWQMTRIQKTTNYFHCSMKKDDETNILLTKILIIAAGSWEKNSFASGLQNDHQHSDLLAFKTHFTRSNLDADLMPLILFPGGYGGLVQSSHNQISLSCCIRRDMLQLVRKIYSNSSAAEAVLQHIRKNNYGVDSVLATATRSGPWLSVGPIRPGIRQRYENGIFYLGNVTGEAHPIVAEGISMAMQSAYLLSRLLLVNKNLSAVGVAYTKQWHKYFSPRIYAAAFFANILMQSKMLDLYLPLIKRFPKILTYGAKLSGKAKFII